ncbi:MAG: glucose dehydrogenase [Desulfuromonas sp.]|nr:MAG: glucose dehydrogenase [Desulfuromonas sp.]
MKRFSPPILVTLATIFLLSGCDGNSLETGASASGNSLKHSPQAQVLNTTLQAPWGMAFLPDGRSLVTEKRGRLLILDPDGRTQTSISGVPLVDPAKQGGLLDVALDPDFSDDPWIYISYSEPGTGSETGLTGTAIARARLVGDQLENLQVIYRQVPKVSGNGHFGSRLVFATDKTLFVTLGERQKKTPAQDLKTSLGKIIRIKRDGSIPEDNPKIPGARPEIWSYGHRNPQGAALRPGTDQLWAAEHGPQGGDEINRITPGSNYGWPLVSYGCNYGDPVGETCRIGGGTHAPAYVEPVSIWVPISIAPSGMTFYTGDRYTGWQGDIFVGALAGRALWRVKLDGDREVEREVLFKNLEERIRNVEQGLDGWLYLLTDSGKLIRVTN